MKKRRRNATKNSNPTRNLGEAYVDIEELVLDGDDSEEEGGIDVSNIQDQGCLRWSGGVFIMTYWALCG